MRSAQIIDLDRYRSRRREVAGGEASRAPALAIGVPVVPVAWVLVWYWFPAPSYVG